MLNFGFLAFRTIVVFSFAVLEIVLAQALLHNILFTFIVLTLFLFALYISLTRDEPKKVKEITSASVPEFGSAYYSEYVALRNILNYVISSSGQNLKVNLLIFDSLKHAKDEPGNDSVAAFQIEGKNYIEVPTSFFILSGKDFEAGFAHEVGHILCNHTHQAFLRVTLQSFLKDYHPLVLGILLGLYLHLWFMIPIFYLVLSKAALLSYSAHSRQRENTADGIATLMGYGDNLMSFLECYTEEPDCRTIKEKYAILLSDHPGLNSRVSYISSLTRKLKK